MKFQSLKGMDDIVSPEVEQVILKALAKQRDDRYMRVADFVTSFKKAWFPNIDESDTDRMRTPGPVIHVIYGLFPGRQELRDVLALHLIRKVIEITADGIDDMDRPVLGRRKQFETQREIRLAALRQFVTMLIRVSDA